MNEPEKNENILPYSHLVVWHCVKCGQPVTTWEGGNRYGCPGCHATGAWAGDRKEVPKGCLVVGDEKPEKKRRFLWPL